MESIELALTAALRSGTSIEVKKEIMDEIGPRIPLEHQGDLGSSADKALDVDEVYVELSEYIVEHTDYFTCSTQLEADKKRRPKRAKAAPKIKKNAVAKAPMATS